MSTLNIRFQRGPLARWSVTVTYSRRVEGDLPRFFVMLSDPTYNLNGIMAVAPGESAYDAVWAANWHGGGYDRLLAALDAVIEQGSEWLDGASERIPAELRPQWRQIVDAADHQRAEFYATYPDGSEPPFTVVHELAYDRATGELVAA
jgi:hypothetical protein